VVSLAIAAALAFPSIASAYVLDRWYVVMLGEQRAGWMHFREVDEGWGLTTLNAIHLEVARGPATIAVDITSSFIETNEGEPFELTTTESYGADPVTRTFRWQDDGSIKVTVEQQGQSTLQTLDPIPGEWLTPVEARRLVATSIMEEAPEFEYTMLDFITGATTTHVKSTLIGPTAVKVMGKTLPAVKLTSTQSTAPGVESTEYIGDYGTPVKTVLNVGGLEMTVLLSEPELAQSDLEPAEIMMRTFVTPSRAIAAPRSLRRASYILGVPEGRMPDLITTSVQHVERIDPQHVRVVIDLDTPQEAPDDDVRDSRSAFSSAMISWRDTKIQELGKEAVGAMTDANPVQKAELARRFVYQFVEDKSLDVGFASASEVCRTRQGDCTEHATLLAAMLRTQGIRSRVVSGLIYAEEFAGRSRIFGYHMWTQALVKDSSGAYRWVDVDGTLPADVPFDATHIALSASAMTDGESINSMAALAPLLGRLEVEVESTGPQTP